jgi:nucleotidyltransferase/DNA polymerase involved in DNA repair
MSDAKSKSWRDVLLIHPAAEIFPAMSKDELHALGEDIKKTGLISGPVIWEAEKDAQLFLLDGRSRLDAMEAVGIETVKDGWLAWNIQRKCLQARGGDPYAFVLSANIHRRHLTSEQKRELIAKVLKAKPETSNRTIAKQVKADDKTVAKVRADLESTAEIPQLEKTVGKDGKQRSAKIPTAKRSTAKGKATPGQQVFDSPQEAHRHAKPTPPKKADYAALAQSWLDVYSLIKTGSSRLRDALEIHRDKINHILERL